MARASGSNPGKKSGKDSGDTPGSKGGAPASGIRLWAGFGLILLVVAAGFWWTTRGPGDEGPIREVDNRELARLVEAGVKVVDIREPWEWAETGVIEGSLLITAFDAQGRVQPDFVPRLREVVQPDEEVVFICRTGNRTSVLTPALVEQLGFEKIRNVTYGILPWIQSGRPVAACALENGVPRC
jgi:rhodanese-related sulfurtransferase